jgi:hypothetical protein
MTEQAVENKIVQKWYPRPVFYVADLFIELNVDGLAELRHEIDERSIPFKTTWWGYDSIQIDDPDGNELLFPIEGNSPSKE